MQCHQKANHWQQSYLCDKQIGFAELVISIIRAIHQENSYCAGVSSRARESERERERFLLAEWVVVGGTAGDAGTQLTEVLCVTLELSRV